ncbi:hypothetical protein FRUB_03382 [Fimbriiglobus ruber]|uniref:Uncharacterized protein n=1 Tax=Fimbriiglobus ruber TaxID=1908690 RepID=A0A225DRR1_9BACT|nr:hypothetical protein FRUB_03382 [Fimbriiglobus ruber]
MTLLALAALVAMGATNKPDFLVRDPVNGDGSPKCLPTKAHQANLGHLRALIKGDITRDVIAGRRSLLEAAAFFRSLNALPGTLKTHLPEPPSGLFSGTDEGRICWHVILAVRGLLIHHPNESPDFEETVVARLVAEFEDEMCYRGEVNLTDPPPVAVQRLLDQAWHDWAAERRIGWYSESSASESFAKHGH